MENSLKSATRQFEYYKLLGERTLNQLKDEDLFGSIKRIIKLPN